jgi:Bacterial Ig domain/Secretion system C-terminal sorting domain/Dockerin type I domain
LLAIIGCCRLAMGQSTSAYRNLTTAQDLIVRDTLSGQNLRVNLHTPLAGSGTVQINLLSAGGGGVPAVHEIRYTPQPGFVGVDTFVVELNYGVVYPYLAYRGYRVCVFPSILVPGEDFAVTTANTPVQIDVLANDRCSAGSMFLADLTGVNHGTASVDAAGKILFTPRAGFTGIAHLNYRVCDALGICANGTANIGVSGAEPRTDTLRVATTKNTSFNMPLLYSGYTLFQAPANGSVALPGGQAFRYTPRLNFTGTETFVLEKTVTTGRVFKRVQVDVINTPTPNTMALEDVVYTPVDQPVTFNVRANDIGSLAVRSWSAPSGLPGTLSGTAPDGSVTFTPRQGFSGIATFSYRIGNDQVPDLEMATVTVVVGNLSPAAAAYELTTPIATPLVINYKIPFLGFDFSLAEKPKFGQCQIEPGFSTRIINGQIVSGHNLLIYTPSAAFYGVDTFKVDYCIPANGDCQSITIAVNVANMLSATESFCVNDCVWSGDLNNDGIVNNKDLLPLGYHLGLTGPERPAAAMEWFGQQAADWDNPFSAGNVDLKYSDTDGNGVINSTDIAPIEAFYGQTHNLTPNIPPTSKGLPFVFKLLTPNPGVGDRVEIEVSLGTDRSPVTNVYGFTLEATLSPSIKDSAFQMEYYPNSWLVQNSPYLTLSKTPRARRLESAFTRTNGRAVSGRGRLGKMDFIVIEIIDGGRPGEATYATVTIENSAILWGDGHTTIGEPITLEIPLRIGRAPVGNVDSRQLLLYPSPTSDFLQVQLNGGELIEQLNIVNTSGQTVYQSGPVQWEYTDLSVGHLPAGVYFVAVRTASGQVVKQFQVF